MKQDLREKLIQPKPNRAVIMAGGKGIRLRPLTKICPKPMVKVAGKPILERIILRFLDHGISKIYISVNYLGKMIEDYFEDGSHFGCEIKYLKEKKYLHTGGSLSLLKEKLEHPLIVMNGDLVTRIDFDHFLNFHQKGKYVATMGVRPYNFEIPFGVVLKKKNRMTSLQEKPTASILINAGIYVLNPEVMKLIPKNRVFPLTDLFEKLIAQKKKIGVYEMQEDWIDVGRLDELEKARRELLKFEEKCLKNSKKS